MILRQKLNQNEAKKHSMCQLITTIETKGKKRKYSQTPLSPLWLSCTPQQQRPAIRKYKISRSCTISYIPFCHKPRWWWLQQRRKRREWQLLPVIRIPENFPSHQKHQVFSAHTPSALRNRRRRPHWLASVVIEGNFSTITLYLFPLLQLYFCSAFKSI